MYRFALFVAGLLAAASATGSNVQFSKCDIGEVYSFSSAACKIQLVNTSGSTVNIELVSHKGDIVTPNNLNIPAGETAIVAARISVAESLGEMTRYIEARFSGGERTYIPITGFVMSTLTKPKTAINFGRVEASRDDLPEISVELASHDAPGFRVTRVIDRPSQVDVRIDPGGTRVTASIRHDADWGIFDGVIKLAVASPYQNEAWIPVSGLVIGEIAPSENPYWFDGSAAANKGSVLIPLFHRGGLPFAVGHVSLELAKGRAVVVPCMPDMPGCRAIQVRFDQTESGGLTRGVLRVELPNIGKTLVVRIWGILASGDRAASMGPDDPAEQAGEPSPWSPSIIESLNAPVYAVPTSPAISDEIDAIAHEAGPPSGSGPLLQWSATDERAAYGYQVFRAPSETGPYARLNKNTIRVHAKAHAGQPYYWRDTTAVNGTAYWYYVGVVYKDGRKQELTPRQQVVAH